MVRSSEPFDLPVVVASASRPPISVRGAFPESVKRSTVAIKVLTSWGRARFRDVVKSTRWRFGASPLTSTISAVVDSVSDARCGSGCAIAVTAASGIYAAEHFAIKTDIHELVSHDLPWAKRSLQYMKAFPQFGIIVVIDAPTPELAEQASTALTRGLRAHPERFLAVSHPGSGKFFEQNGLLFLPTDDVSGWNALRQADPLVATLAEDRAFENPRCDVHGLHRRQARNCRINDMASPLTMAADSSKRSQPIGPRAFHSGYWRAADRPRPTLGADFQVEPVLDFAELQPGRTPLS